MAIYFMDLFQVCVHMHIRDECFGIVIGQTLLTFYTPPHDSDGVLWYPVGCPCVCPIRLSVCRTYVRPSVFLFPDDNLSKCQWIFTKFGVCIDIVKIWFGIVNGQISSILTELSACSMSEFLFPGDD